MDNKCDYQFSIEDDICFKLKSFDIDGAKTAFTDNFNVNMFEDLGNGQYLRSVKNHLICLNVSISRSMATDSIKCCKLKKYCNEFINKIENLDDIKELMDLGVNMIITYGEVIKSISFSCENVIINRAIEYIEANLEKPLTLDIISKDIFVSKNYLSSLFIKKTGFKFTYYINLLRVDKSKNLLSNSNYTLSYISSICGFKNQNYFSTIFKKFTGYSPNEYKRTVSNK